MVSHSSAPTPHQADIPLLGQSRLLVSPELLNSLEDIGAHVGNCQTAEEFFDRTRPLAERALESAFEIPETLIQKVFGRLVQEFPNLERDYVAAGIFPYPKDPETAEVLNPFVSNPSKKYSFSNVGKQLTTEAFVASVWCEALALANGGERQDVEFPLTPFSEPSFIRRVTGQCLYGRLNKAFHLMLQWAARDTRAGTGEILRDEYTYVAELDEMSPTHSGPEKRELTLDQFLKHLADTGTKSDEERRNFFSTVFERSEGPHILNGYRVHKGRGETLVSFEPSDIEHTITELATSLFGPVAIGEKQMTVGVDPISRQLLSNQAGLYNAQNLFLVLDESSTRAPTLRWGVPREHIDTGKPLADHITEAVWRVGILSVALVKQIAPDRLKGDGEFTSVNADLAQSFLIGLVQQRIAAEG